jgi:hypothetical protein
VCAFFCFCQSLPDGRFGLRRFLSDRPHLFLVEDIAIQKPPTVQLVADQAAADQPASATSNDGKWHEASQDGFDFLVSLLDSSLEDSPLGGEDGGSGGGSGGVYVNASSGAGDHLTVTELRARLKSFGQPTAGLRKADLIDRLNEHLQTMVTSLHLPVPTTESRYFKYYYR